jgi:hydrogenase nickel incorporation protein HypA/HybF
MHEYSLVQALLARVQAQAEAHHASAVHRVVVRIGPLAGVERELFATAFRNCREALPVCAGAELEMTGEDVRWRCPVCNEEVPPGRVLACPECGWPASLAEGDSLVLERLELEVPEHV